jgi:hypothetical protein
MWVVMDAEAVLVGNSQGGPAAIERGTHTLAVIGVDTFQDVSQTMDLNQVHEMAEAWRRDFLRKLEEMLRVPLHSDIAPKSRTCGSKCLERRWTPCPRFSGASAFTIRGHPDGSCACCEVYQRQLLAYRDDPVRDRGLRRGCAVVRHAHGRVT